MVCCIGKFELTIKFVLHVFFFLQNYSDRGTGRQTSHQTSLVQNLQTNASTARGQGDLSERRKQEEEGFKIKGQEAVVQCGRFVLSSPSQWYVYNSLTHDFLLLSVMYMYDTFELINFLFYKQIVVFIMKVISHGCELDWS